MTAVIGMLDSAYLAALSAAGLVMPDGYFAGSTVWRERGLKCVDLMVNAYLRRLGDFSRPDRVEHAFLMPQEPYREVFPDYRNVYATRSANTQPCVLRPDNLHASVRALADAGLEGPLVAVGGLLRHFRGPVQPLFRERYIWPAVQTTHLVPPDQAVAALDRHQRALEAFLDDLALPALSVATDLTSDYGDPCYLTVSCLPDGRPTVLSTSYVLSRRRTAALGVSTAVLDVGFTGKLLALIAAHHRDSRGLILPSCLAPVQIGITRPPDCAVPDIEPWLKELSESGLRGATREASDSAQVRRQRAERRWLRAGVPVVLTGRPGRGDEPATRMTLTRRLPLDRASPRGLPGVPELHAELDASDARLRQVTARRFQRALWDSGLLRTVCENCIGRQQLPVFGRVTPGRPGPCSLCPAEGEVVLFSESGRFY
jgi:hypothetical protein